MLHIVTKYASRYEVVWIPIFMIIIAMIYVLPSDRPISTEAANVAIPIENLVDQRLPAFFLHIDGPGGWMSGQNKGEKVHEIWSY
jgi:hypothetical protein